MAAKVTILIAAVALSLTLGACGGPAAEVAAPAAPAAPSAPVVRHPDPNTCAGDGGGSYSGLFCHPEGVLVTASRALDAATLELTDGRQVRLLGVIAPAAGSCPASAATAAANALVAGQEVNVVTEPGAGADPFGQPWVYIQVGQWHEDLGDKLAMAGWVAEYPQSPASADYLQTVASSVDFAQATHTGQWGPPCGPALPDPTTTAASDSGRDIDVDIDHHGDDHKSRWCRRHIWC